MSLSKCFITSVAGLFLLAAIPTWKEITNPVDGVVWDRSSSIEIKETWRLKETTKLEADRIVIKAPIYTEGESLSIVARELWFEEGGVIYGYHPNTLPKAIREIPAKPSAKALNGLDYHSKDFFDEKLTKYYFYEQPFPAISGNIVLYFFEDSLVKVRIDAEQVEPLQNFLTFWRREVVSWNPAKQSAGEFGTMDIISLQKMTRVLPEKIARSIAVKSLDFFAQRLSKANKKAFKDFQTWKEKNSSDAIFQSKVFANFSRHLNADETQEVLNFYRQKIFEYYLESLHPAGMPKPKGFENLIYYNTYQAFEWLVPREIQMRGKPGRPGDRGYDGEKGNQNPSGVSIFAENLLGKVRIELSGQTGGTGGQGGPGQDGGDGGLGKNGDRGLLGGFLGGGSGPRIGGDGGQGGAGGAGGRGGDGGQPIPLQMAFSVHRDLDGRVVEAEASLDLWSVYSIGGKAGEPGKGGQPGRNGKKGQWGEGKQGFWPRQKNNVSDDVRDELDRKNDERGWGQTWPPKAGEKTLRYDEKGEAVRTDLPKNSFKTGQSLSRAAEKALIDRFYPLDFPNGFAYKDFNLSDFQKLDRSSVRIKPKIAVRPESLSAIKKQFMLAAFQYHLDRNRWALFLRSLDFTVRLSEDAFKKNEDQDVWAPYLKNLSSDSYQQILDQISFSNQQEIELVRSAWARHTAILNKQIQKLSESENSFAGQEDAALARDLFEFADLSEIALEFFDRVQDYSSLQTQSELQEFAIDFQDRLIFLRDSFRRRLENYAVDLVDLCTDYKQFFESYEFEINQTGADSELLSRYLSLFRIPACLDRPWMLSDLEIDNRAIFDVSTTIPAHYPPGIDLLKVDVFQPDLNYFLPPTLRQILDASLRRVSFSSVYAQSAADEMSLMNSGVNEDNIRVILNGVQDYRVKLPVPKKSTEPEAFVEKRLGIVSRLEPIEIEAIKSPNQLSVVLSVMAEHQALLMREFLK